MEDIHGLFALSKKPPKPQLMANYYHKVSTVFWKSGNALFHASTLHRLYHLSREMRKNLTQEEMQRWGKRLAVVLESIFNLLGSKIKVNCTPKEADDIYGYEQLCLNWPVLIASKEI